MNWQEYCEMEKESDFQEAVRECLSKLEKQHNIQIVVASDTGSRSCNIHSFNSDLDVHFIYLYKDLQAYFSIKTAPDVLTITDKVVLKDKSEVEINCSGWEMRKACQLLATSNAAIVELIHYSRFPQNQFFDNFHQNPFFFSSSSTTSSEPSLRTKMSFVKLGFHYRSISYTVQKKKLPLSEKETATKNYLNMIRYINLSQQLVNIMNQTGLDYNDYLQVEPENLSFLPEYLRQKQKELLEKRRSRVWQMERDEELESQLEKILDEHLVYFRDFKESSTLEDLKADNQKDVLFQVCDDICKETLARSVC